jgi:2-haloacid dehalogenase
MDSYLRLDLFPEVKQTFGRLAEFELAILSNGSPQMLQSLVSFAGLDRICSHVLSVDQTKIYKPSPAAYQVAVTQTGVEKDRIGFVSSNFWDVAGAKSFGFRSYWINRSGAAADELGIKPDATVTSLGELVELVELVSA